MTSICDKKISAKVRLIHAEHVSLYNFIFLRKKTIDTAEDLITGDILNQLYSMSFSKLY